MTSARVPDNVEAPEPTVEEVSEGIFAYVQLDGSWGLNNTGFVVGKEAVVAVDTCFTERRSRAFARAIEDTVRPATQTGPDGPRPGAGKAQDERGRWCGRW